uniref:Uncharacterized protein n=1 Tax=Zea mays TaxID=4577 RepID=A0A804PME4_MAIZE
MAAAAPAQGKLLPKSAHGYKISSVQPHAWHKCSDLDPADKISRRQVLRFGSERIPQPLLPSARIPQPLFPSSRGSPSLTGTEPLVLSDLSSTTRHGIVGVFIFVYHGFRSCIFGVCSHYNALIIVAAL